MHTVFHISDCLLEGKQVISLEHLLLESCISLAKYQICLTAYAFFSILFEVYICVLYFPPIPLSRIFMVGYHGD